MRKEDINKYNTTTFQAPSRHTEGEFTQSAGATVKTMGGMLWKAFKTVFWVLAITGVLCMLSVASFILSFRDVEPPDINATSLNFSSMIMLDDQEGNSSEYLPIARNEDRIWMPLSEIPQAMQTAQIAIEDHRFYQHQGVDLKGTFGAVFKLLTNSGNGGGGSTLTQQLIKNITNENQVSVLRKIKEIFTALNMEDNKYTKSEILEAYLNIVNYGGICQGVEAAARCYFDKSITECSLAECALIAGITQNPYQFNPLIFPEASKEKAEVVLDRMLKLTQEGELDTEHLMPLSQAEHDAAVAELAQMDFVGAEIEETDNQENQDHTKWNWYIDYTFNQVVSDLMDRYGYSWDYACNMIYNGGLEIHCAMDYNLQTDLERYFLSNTGMLPGDEDIELGFFMMDPYTGRVLATIGGRYEREGSLLESRSTDSQRQCGSSMKGLSPYALGIANGTITYGSILKDEPLADWNGEGGEPGPANWNGVYKKYMCVDEAIERSINAPAAQLCTTLTPESCYEWLTQSLHFTSPTEADSHSRSAMSLGGLSWGVTVEEMTAGYQIFANGGVYHKPFGYYYVKDHNNNVILDNRDTEGTRVMSEERATIMNKLLHGPIFGAQATGGQLAGLSYEYGIDLFGKTGTTDDEYDLYFVGGTPFCVAGIWNGYDIPRDLIDQGTHMDTWYAVMAHLMENYDWSGKQWVLSDNVYAAAFCRSSGKLAGSSCFDTATGWYEPGNAPSTCNGGSDHIAGPTVSPSVSPSVAPSVGPSVAPSVGPSVSPSAGPSAEPSPSGGDGTPEPSPTEDPQPTPTEEPEPSFPPNPWEPDPTPTDEPSSSDPGISSSPSEPGDNPGGEDPPGIHTPDVPQG
ncbi:transglycosylase domain-containing protein [Oscillospiraceae bacterium 42-9]